MAVAAPPAPSTVLRLPIDDPGWAHRLPRVPGATLLTISAPTAETAEITASCVQDLRDLGYVFIGHVPVNLGSVGRVVDLVVPGPLVEEEPTWWREVTAIADRVLPLLFGPVQRRLGGLAAAHRALRPHRI